jgi:ribosomal protein L24
MKNKIKLKKGDEVIVLSGKDKEKLVKLFVSFLTLEK